LSAEVGWHRDRATAFYRRAAWLALTIALAGFFLTYSLPLARGTFDGPSIAHVHGALLFGWLGLVIVQTVLVRAPATHRKIGWLGLALALAVAVSTVVMGHNSATRAIERGDGPIALSGFMGSVTTPAIFLALVVTAIALRRRPQWHKRLIFRRHGRHPVAGVVSLAPFSTQPAKTRNHPESCGVRPADRHRDDP
jgi:hypothetical protein